MSDEKALLAAILANPDEDTPRLVYADWLQEHGDASGLARAEFIRLQIEAAQLPEDDRRRAALTKRYRELARHHQTTWKREFNENHGGKHLVGEFQRGFITRLTGVDSDIAAYFPLAASAHPIQEIFTEAEIDNDPGMFGPVATCPALAKVRRIKYTRLPAAVAQTLFSSPHLTGLRVLRLQWCTSAAIELLSRSVASKSLRELGIWDSGYGGVNTDSALGTLLTAEWPALETVRIDNCAVRDGGVQLLVADFAARRRRALHVSEDTLTVQGARTAIEAVIPTELNSLSLSLGGNVNVAVGRAEPHIQPHGGRELRLEGFQNDGDALVRWLVQTVPPGRFDHLGLVRCQISRAGARALASWAGLSTLKELDLQSNWIGDGGAADLSASPHLQDVGQLLVAHNDITKTGKEALKKRFGRRVRLS
jgi:uncharacterized protein (TIGR02996 family)